MIRLLYYLFLISAFFSCKIEYKKCEVQTNDTILKVYNDILNEIIARQSYNFYLGEDEEAIFKRYAHNIADSVNIDKDVIKLHNRLFGDTSRFCTIYLDTLLRQGFRQWTYFKRDTSLYSRTIRDLISIFSEDGQSIIDSLNSLQVKYSSNDFQICIAKLKPVTALNLDKPRCYIGKIAFSKLVLNQTKDKGLLYYDFNCGGRCGYGRLIVIAKVKNVWTIQESITTWIS